MAATVLGSFFFVWPRSSYMTHQGVAREQPVPFSHEHHVGGIGIDCRYCHTSVETSAFAGIPPTKTCMNCHSQIWNDSPDARAGARELPRRHAPIAWTRVHDLPDFVYFNHSIHVNKGVGCVTCHGRVDQMPLIWQDELAADGVVPRLPPEPRERTCGRARGLQHRLAAARRPARARRAARPQELRRQDRDATAPRATDEPRTAERGTGRARGRPPRGRAPRRPALLAEPRGAGARPPRSTSSCTASSPRRPSMLGATRRAAATS